MTQTEMQVKAIQIAITEALSEMGLALIKSSEFFGTNQRVAEPLQQAA